MKRKTKRFMIRRIVRKLKSRKQLELTVHLLRLALLVFTILKLILWA